MENSKLDRITAIRAGSWAMYDFANTIYSFIVVTMYLPPLLEKITGSNFLMSFSNVFSMVIAGFSAPALGALTDRSKCAKRWLIIVTIICCVACGGIGILIYINPNPELVMCFVIGLTFVIANFTYQIGLMFYNSFLPTLVPKSIQGKVSGLGIALGYVGVLAVIIPAKYVYLWNYWSVFLFGGVMFFLFSLPMFIFVPERMPLKDEKITGKVVKEEIHQFVELFKNVSRNKNLLYCLLANFLAVDAVNTAILFFTTFLKKAVFYGLEKKTMENYITNQMLALTISAVIMSFVIGWLTDKIGSKKSFFVAAISMGTASVCGCLIPRGLGFYFTVTVFGGAGLVGAWTAGRKLLADITPEGKEGEYFGLYGLTNKSSAVGTIFFATITYFLPKFNIVTEPVAYRVAFLFSLVTISASIYFLRKVKI
jgi:UMF1 family MFS transporter